MDKLNEEYWASGQAPGNFARVVREYEVRGARDFLHSDGLTQGQCTCKGTCRLQQQVSKVTAAWSMQ